MFSFNCCFLTCLQVPQEAGEVVQYFHLFKKIMASGPIISWEIDGEKVETVSDFILGGSKITADGDCSYKLKDAYSLEGKLWPTQIAYSKAETLLFFKFYFYFILLYNTLLVLPYIDMNPPYITLPRKVRLVKAMVFPVVMYGCES